MPNGDQHNFRIRRRQVAVYFNDGHGSSTVWAPTHESGLKNPKFQAAIAAASKAFFKIWNNKDWKPSKRLADACAKACACGRYQGCKICGKYQDRKRTTRAAALGEATTASTAGSTRRAE